MWHIREGATVARMSGNGHGHKGAQLSDASWILHGQEVAFIARLRHVTRAEQVLFVWHILLAGFILAANVGLVYFICGQKRSRTTHNMTIVSIAVADLMVGVVVLPTHLALILYPTDVDSVALYLCKMNRYLSCWSRTVMIYSSLGMVINRYFKVVDPRDNSFMAGRCMFYLNFVWFSGAAYNIWQVVLANSQEIPLLDSKSLLDTNLSVRRCAMAQDFRSLQKGFHAADLLLVYGFPLMGATLCYGAMARHLWKDCGATSRLLGRRRLLMSFLLCVLFALCQLPAQIAETLVIPGEPLTEGTVGLLAALDSLACSQALLNVLAYCITSKELQRTWYGLLNQSPLRASTQSPNTALFPSPPTMDVATETMEALCLTCPNQLT